MAPMYSDVYIVKEILGAGWTYNLYPENKHGGVRAKQRHFNNLKEVCRLGMVPQEDDEQQLKVEWRVEHPTPKITPKSSREQTGEKSVHGELRRSSRTRKKTSYLTMETEPGGKR